MNTRNHFILHAFNELKTRMLDHSPFDQEALNEEDQDFLDAFDLVLISVEQQKVDYGFQGQDILTRLIRCYPNLVPLIRRELLWFIGGECLHYLGDEEVDLFQELEDRLYTFETENTKFDIDAQIKQLREDLATSHTQTKH